MNLKDVKVNLIPINKLKPYKNNPRINENAVDGVAESIKTFGFKQPIVVDKKMVIIVGHTRYEAAKKLDIKKVPVIVAEDLPPKKVKAYRIADNKTAEFSKWDEELLGVEIKSLQNIFTGFDAIEIAGLIGDVNFDPASIDDQGSLDTLDPKWCTCPHCKKRFDLREQN